MRTLLCSLLLIGLSSVAVGEPSRLDGNTLGTLTVTFADGKIKIGETEVDAPVRQGVAIVFVDPKGPCGEAKMPLGTVITQVGRTRVANNEEYAAAVKAAETRKDLVLTAHVPIASKNRVRWRKRAIHVAPITRRELLTNLVTKSSDKIAGVDTFHHYADELDHERTGLYFRVFEEGDETMPAICIMYQGDDWIFARKYIFVAGTERAEVTPGLGQVNRDNTAGSVWEWYYADCPVDSQLMKTLAKALETGNMTVRIEGDTYKHDHELNVWELYMLRIMADFIELRTGEAISAE